MTPWRYKVSWGERVEEVSILFGDRARFEAKAGKSWQNLVEQGLWTSWHDGLLVYTALQRLKVQPEQSFDDFLDTADVELLEFGEASEGKAQGRAASSGTSPRSRSSAAKTR